MKKKNKSIKLNLNKEVISVITMKNTKGGGLTDNCPSVPPFPAQFSRTCCTAPVYTVGDDCNVIHLSLVGC